MYSWFSSSATLRPGQFTTLLHLCFWFYFALSEFLKCIDFIFCFRIVLAVIRKIKSFRYLAKDVCEDVLRSTAQKNNSLYFSACLVWRTETYNFRDCKKMEMLPKLLLQIITNLLQSCTRAFAMCHSSSKFSDFPTPFINKSQKIEMIWAFSLTDNISLVFTQCTITLILQAICQSLQADTLATCILAKNVANLLIL